mmetsp:Transcript_43309/g.102745  ORF Transcript_43309/g.102745 Transcript_43309/m.102745 type:complete len:202 (-) Transcript_43309:93-698(-)
MTLREDSNRHPLKIPIRRKIDSAVSLTGVSLGPPLESCTGSQNIFGSYAGAAGQFNFIFRKPKMDPDFRRLSYEFLGSVTAFLLTRMLQKPSLWQSLVFGTLPSSILCSISHILKERIAEVINNRVQTEFNTLIVKRKHIGFCSCEKAHLQRAKWARTRYVDILERTQFSWNVTSVHNMMARVKQYFLECKTTSEGSTTGC